MKKIYFFFLLVYLSSATNAQNTITFLGVPIDGTKREMISKLVAKGFEYNPSDEYLYGEFNGQDVQISIHTVNNRVWRLGVMDVFPTNEVNIKNRYNILFDQFLNNGKYYCVSGQKLNEKDDISYEITVNNKRYDAGFGLVNSSINGFVWYMIAKLSDEYKIVIFYENGDNAANGNDL